MAKAHMVTKDGTKIIIEGKPQEVAMLINQLEGKTLLQASQKQKKTPKAKYSSQRQKTTPINLICSLIDGGFFNKPKDLASVKVALEELGHFYPVTTLSPALLRLVRKKQLRRIKEKKRWLYTG